MIGQRIRALERKLAKELAQIEAQELAEEYVAEYHRATDRKQSLPDPFIFCMKAAKTSVYFLKTTARTLNYLEHCLRNRQIPDGPRIVRLLLPWHTFSPRPTFLM